MGCSTSTCEESCGQSAVSSCPTAPGSSIPVTTLTAASTPIAVCGCIGMNERVQTWPPSRGGESRAVFGTDDPDTSPRPISCPTLHRKASTRSSSAVSAANCSCGSSPVSPNDSAIATTTGMPLSTQVTSIPSTESRTFPVGSRLPVVEPAVSVNASTIGAAVPGTPAMATSPRYSTRPSGVGKVATAMLSELTMRIRTFVSGDPAGTSPRSTANGPTPARMLPQFCWSLTVGKVVSGPAQHRDGGAARPGTGPRRPELRAQVADPAQGLVHRSRAVPTQRLGVVDVRAGRIGHHHGPHARTSPAPQRFMCNNGFMTTLLVTM